MYPLRLLSSTLTRSAELSRCTRLLTSRLYTSSSTADGERLSTPDGISDKIHLNGMVFHGTHGFHPEENKFGQKFVVDVVMERSLEMAGLTDDLQHTIDYGQAFDIVKTIMEDTECKLLETVATNIARSLISEFNISKVTVALKKPQVHVTGVVNYLGVEICRKRAWRDIALEFRDR
eukprot:GFYU01027902.1.p1 GENE.GFYU01027902.1~~GFYU01027902.1.p1  ORF type:complete len:177 (-),score=24.50 GFYU01027902.1:316-846(-)